MCSRNLNRENRENGEKWRTRVHKKKKERGEKTGKKELHTIRASMGALPH
jgi:hypothetical protein